MQNMDDVVKRLIEVDKAARKRVDDSKERQREATGQTDKLRVELKEKSDKVLKARIENEKLLAGELLKSEKQKAELDTKAKLLALNKLFSEKKDEWVSELFSSVTNVTEK